VIHDGQNVTQLANMIPSLFTVMITYISTSFVCCQLLHITKYEIKMSQPCKRPNCTGLGTSHCRACQNVFYCSVGCQHAHWKDHKITCGKELLSESELSKFLMDAMDKARGLDPEDDKVKFVKYLKATLLFAEYQFGDRVPNESYRRRKDGVILKEDWDIFILRDMLTEFYINEHTATSFDVALGYATETREQLEMRKSNAENPEKFFYLIFRVNSQLDCILALTLRFDECLHYAQEALTAARLCGHDDENNKKPSCLVQALQMMATATAGEEGVKFAEEAYILVSEKHGPVHPYVQEAAASLISIYLGAGNFVDAERFARINYESLIDPNNGVNLKSQNFADGKLTLAKVWFKTPADQRIGGPEAAEEAETLAREACNIRENITSVKPFYRNKLGLSMTLEFLADLMLERGKLNEFETVLLKALSLTKDCRVGEVPRVGSSSHRYHVLNKLGNLYFFTAIETTTNETVTLLEKSKYKFAESLRIAVALFSPDDIRVLSPLKTIRIIDEALSGMAVCTAQNGVLREGKEGWI
jgi:MYND finger